MYKPQRDWLFCLLLKQKLICMVKLRRGMDVEAAARSFWVPPLCLRGMLFSLDKGGKYFLSTGSTPAVCYVFCQQDIKLRRARDHVVMKL